MKGWKEIFKSGFFFPLILPCTVRFLFTAFVLAEVRLCHLPTPSMLCWCFGETALNFCYFDPLYLSCGGHLWILTSSYLQSQLWETVKVSVILLFDPKQHSDSEAVSYHSRWLVLQESSLRKPDDLVCKIAGNRDSHLLPSGLLSICPFTTGIHFPSQLTGFSSQPALCISGLD